MRRAAALCVTTVLVAVAGLASAGVAAADSSPKDPTDPATPTTVTADALSTAQINGVVWSQTVVNDIVYAGGNFSSARPPGAPAGTSETPRSNLVAYNINTGELTSFAPVVNGQVRSVTASPDKTRLYIGGTFTTVNGQTRNRIAAFDVATGALVAGFAPPVNYDVYSVVATNTTVFAGGDFQGVGTKNRGYLASFTASTGALLDWAPQAAGGKVWALVLNPTGTKIVVGGQFTTLNGSANPGYGLGMLDTTTGASLPMAANSVIRNGGSVTGITTLASDGQTVYGGGYTFGGGGNFEGSFGASWDGGTLKFLNDCHGDTYSVYPRGGAVYLAGHPHYCGNVGGFPQTTPDWTFYRGLAFGTTATGTATREPYGYANFQGQPSSSPLAWYPSINAGTFTGQAQGPWSVSGNDDYIVMAGEFTKVNNKAQQGLVRFPKKELSPNAQGPSLFNATYPLNVVSTEAGKARISWGTNQDLDNDNLTYRVYRDAQLKSGLVYETTARANFWAPYTMGFTDSGLAPGSTHQYRVAVTDPFGNIANSPWATVTAAASGVDSKYLKAVYASQPNDFWRLGESTGTTGADRVGFSPLTLGAGVTRGSAGGIGGDADKSSTFNGTSTGIAYTSKMISPPNTFTLEGWFKTNSTTGGKLVGFGDKQTSNSSNYDRQIYMDNAGKIVFGVYDGTTATLASTGTYRNDAWHYVAASLSTTGMKLYVDGSLVGQRATPTFGQGGFWGYWRIGGDNTGSWPSKGTSDYFKGSLDEVALYHRELTPAEISTHYVAGTGGNVVPTAAFTNTGTDLAVAVDGSTSVDPDGTIASYAWSFGDGGTATGATATHTYPGSGTYALKLTVTDNEGATASTTKQVTVTAPNVAPVAAFTTTALDLGLAVDASGSTDSDGTIASYAWAFGDGVTATGPTASHTYAAGGTYAVTLTVTDNKGAATNLTKQVTVTPPNQAPTAVFTSSGADLDQHFDATTSADPDGSIVSFAWEFGDGATGTGNQVDHHYATPGSYTVKLTTTDNRGGVGTLIKQVAVLAPNVAPVAIFTTTKTELKLNVDASGSSDSDGTIASYGWTFGDGGAATGATAEHSYAAGGTYAVTLTVTDDRGGVTKKTEQVSVTPPNQAPTAAFTSSGAALDKRLDGTGSTDPDGTVLAYGWEFGDGATGTGATVDHSYASAGTYQVKLTVTDDRGATGTVTKEVVVTPPNAAPRASFTATKAELKLSVDAAGSTDADGTVESYAWTFGDGASATGKTASHTYASSGTYSVKLTVTDDKGSTDSQSQDVVVTGPLALDGFNRSVSNGWGNADIGGAWVRSGTASNFAVANGAGTIKMGSAGAGPSLALPTVSSSDTDLRVKVGLDKMPTGGGTYVELKPRTVGTDSYYADTKLLANGSVNVTLARTANGVDTSLVTKTVSGLTYSQGTTLNIRVQATGTSGTTLRAKVWKAGTTEPTDWAASVTDSTAALQTAGGIGVGTYLTGSSTNAPVVASFTELSAGRTAN